MQPSSFDEAIAGTNLFVGRGTSIQARAVSNSGAYTPKTFIALFSFNWETSQFVMQSYIQHPTAVPGRWQWLVINSDYDPFTVEFNDKYWTAFE